MRLCECGGEYETVTVDLNGSFMGIQRTETVDTCKSCKDCLCEIKDKILFDSLEFIEID